MSTQETTSPRRHTLRAILIAVAVVFILSGDFIIAALIFLTIHLLNKSAKKDKQPAVLTVAPEPVTSEPVKAHSLSAQKYDLPAINY